MVLSIVSFNPAFLLLEDHPKEMKDKNAHLLLHRKKKKDEHYNSLWELKKEGTQMATKSRMINK